MCVPRSDFKILHFRMELESIMFSERNQTQKVKGHTLSLLCGRYKKEKKRWGELENFMKLEGRQLEAEDRIQGEGKDRYRGMKLSKLCGVHVQTAQRTLLVCKIIMHQ